MRLTNSFGVGKGLSFLVAGVGLSLALPGFVYAWGPSIHQKLAQQYYNQPIISSLAAEFGTNVSAVTSGAGDLDGASADHKSKYHSGQWTMVWTRSYAYTSSWSSNVWSELDETTRLKYIMHNLGDVSVPIGHSPANMVTGAEPNQAKEAILEGLADLGSYGQPSSYAPTSWYSGTVQQITNYVWASGVQNLSQIAGCGPYQYDCIANTLYYLNGSNATAAHESWRISQMLGRVVLADYYLTRRSAADDSQISSTTVGPNVVFDASALRDPDNITWNTDGAYFYRSDWTGITQVQWSFDGDDNYESSGIQISKSYSQLAPYMGQNGSLSYKIAVTDDEGLTWYKTGVAYLAQIPEPSSGLLLILAAILMFGLRVHRR